MMKNNESVQQTGLQDVEYAKVYYAKGKPAVVWIVLLLVMAAPVALYAAANTPEIDLVSKTIYRMLGVEQDTGDPVGGLMEIEEAWAVEDAREEADEPLVTRMYMNGEILGYDRESRTFYCTLGMDHGENWPETAFTAQGSRDLNLRWIDDYSYDYCSDAIAEGYRYELLAWTDEQYEYVGVVFTGLPIVTLHTDGNVPIVREENADADVHIVSAEHGALYSRAQIHVRGGGAYTTFKDSWRIEFRTLDAKGRDKKTERSVLGMETSSDFLLLANSADPTAIRNHLCWEAWKNWKEEKRFAELESRLVEVFCGDEYVGIYQLMEYVDPVKELTAMGGNPDTDAMVRMVTLMNDGKYPQKDRVMTDNHKIELRHAPLGMTADEAFAIFEPFDAVEILRTRDLSDEEFTEIIEKHFDIQNLLDYFLFVQVYNLRDNARNNVYVWAMKQENGVYQYRLSPWDMDRSLCKSEAEGPLNEIEIISWEMPMVNLMLELDIGGCRQKLYDMFYEKRATTISDDALYQWIDEAEQTINASGAYLRESEKWYGGAVPLDLTWMSAEMIMMQSTVDMYIREVWCPGIAEPY